MARIEFDTTSKRRLPLRLPHHAAWRHVGARAGFEVAFCHETAHGMRVDGQTTALEGDAMWALRYTIELDEKWRTRGVWVTELSAAQELTVALEADGYGSWWVDGVDAPSLDGICDVDLGGSMFTNALPIRRLALDPGRTIEAPAVYVAAPGLEVGRLEQTYTRLPDADAHSRYRYAAPAFEFECELLSDRDGLVVEYPGIGRRVA